MTPIAIEHVGVRYGQFFNEIFFEYQFFMPFCAKHRLLSLLSTSNQVQEALLDTRRLIDRAIAHGYIRVIRGGGLPDDRMIWITDEGREFVRPINFLNQLLDRYKNIVTGVLAIIGWIISSSIIRAIWNFFVNHPLTKSVLNYYF